MRIDIPSTRAWTRASDRLRSGLPFQDPSVLVQAYAGYRDALYESTWGLAKLFSHKRTIVLPELGDPAIEAIASAFAEESYTVKRFSNQALSDGRSFTEHLASDQGSDVLFILLSDDDPVTARLIDNSTIDEAFKSTRVFRIRVSHALHRQVEVSRPAPFEVKILSLTPECAVLIGGERVKIRPPLAPRLPWPETLNFTEPKNVFDLQSHRLRIEAFESSLPQGFRPYFLPGQERVFDRSVIVAEGVDGSAVVDELARLQGLRVGAPGADGLFDSISPCRWHEPRLISWLTSRGETEETIRGLVLIAAEAIDPHLSAQLAMARSGILKLQTGEESPTVGA